MTQEENVMKYIGPCDIPQLTVEIIDYLERYLEKVIGEKM